MDLGKFIFLYFVARNVPWRVSNEIMQNLKRTDGRGGQTEKDLLSPRAPDAETYSQNSEKLPPYSYNNANKNRDERIDIPDAPKESSAKVNSRKSAKSRRIRSRSSSPTKDDEYLKACLNDK